MRRRRRGGGRRRLFLRAAAAVLSALWKTLWIAAKLSLRYRFAAAAVFFSAALLVMAHCRRPRGYVKSPAEAAYIEGLRKKYAAAPRRLGAGEAVGVIRAACEFITRAENAPKGLYDSEEAVALLLGTALVESDLAPRFQGSRGDAIGLFQVEYGTFRDLWDRSIKYKHRNLRAAIIREFGGAGGGIEFEDLQKSDVLCAVFARMKYAEFPDKIPRDVAGRAAYYKKFYNTKYGAARESAYVDKKRRALSRPGG